jgi:hypothetical protein
MKLRDSPLCETCPYKATESLQHFLLEYPAYQNIRDQSFQKIVDHMNAAMPCLLSVVFRAKVLVLASNFNLDV